MDMGEKNPIVDPSDHDGFLVRFICNLLSTFDFISLYFFLSISDLTTFIYLLNALPPHNEKSYRSVD